MEFTKEDYGNKIRKSQMTKNKSQINLTIKIQKMISLDILVCNLFGTCNLLFGACDMLFGAFK